MKNIGIAARLSAGAGAAAVSVLLSGCMSTVSGQAVKPANAEPLPVAMLTESKLSGVLLTIGELNGIVGSTQMKVTSELREMTDHSGDVSEPECLAAIYGAEEPVYADTGWTAVRDQVAREPNDNNAHWVEQTAVLYPAAANAEKFFDDSDEVWQGCAHRSISVNDSETTYLWQVDEVVAKDHVLSQLSTQEDADGWACQHALAVVTNLTAEAWACGYTVHDEAATIATEMVANASK